VDGKQPELMTSCFIAPKAAAAATPVITFFVRVLFSPENSKFRETPEENKGGNELHLFPQRDTALFQIWSRSLYQSLRKERRT
jgi:hypothetical protein